MIVSCFKLILARVAAAYFGHSTRASAPALMLTFSLCPLGGSLEMENALVSSCVPKKGRLSPRIISNPINSAQLPLLPFRGQRRSI